MCGICGVVAADNLIDKDREKVSHMNSFLSHRGPDGKGEYQDGNISFAMSRLSIIDLKTGWQPLYNEDKSLVLIANGEIYNFVELRQQLKNRHQFLTGSDCETIIHLYEEHGTECVNYLRGMFAFALWDLKRSRLMIARDRIGEKPLYLYETGKRLYFSSELKVFLKTGVAPFELDKNSVDLFFHYQYVPEPYTIIKEVRKLPAAHWLTVDVTDWKITEQCYWNALDAPEIREDPINKIRETLEETLEMIIRSDVPVGLALSGGLDSSSIATLAAAKYPGVMQSFTVGYSGRPNSDERDAAKRLAERLSMPFHEVEITTQGFVESFSEVIYWEDDPIADISAYGYYRVMRAASDHGVRVMLQGHGGDELFWGYSWVKDSVVQTMRKRKLDETGIRALPAYIKPTRPASIKSKRAVLEWVFNGFGFFSSWKEYFRDQKTPQGQVHFYNLAPDFMDADNGLRSIYTQEMSQFVQPEYAWNVFRKGQSPARIDLLITQLIMDTYLLENGIAQGDRLGMASSVEMRLPLVDHRLIEVVIGLRKAFSDNHLPEKYWFKKAVQGLVPEEVLQRKKQGFTPPVREWMTSAFGSFGNHLVDGYLVQANIINPTAARTLSKGGGPVRNYMPLNYKALVLETWCRHFI